MDHSQLPSWISGTDPRHPLQLFSYLNVARSLDSAVHVNSAWPEDPCRVHPPLKVSTVVPVERFVKVKANNDVDKDVHYRAPSNLKATLCGMQIAELSADGEVTCFRCHQFAIGDI